MLRLILKLQRMFFGNEARVFSRLTPREKWIARKRLKRRFIYSILLFQLFFMYLADMKQGGTLFQAYIDYQQNKMIEKELEEYYIYMGWIYYD